MTIICTNNIIIDLEKLEYITSEDTVIYIKLFGSELTSVDFKSKEEVQDCMTMLCSEIEKKTMVRIEIPMDEKKRRDYHGFHNR